MSEIERKVDISEIERKVDILTRGMKIPPKKTRRRVATIAASLLIAMTLIASASLITYYYEQTAENIDIECAITITDIDGTTVYDTPWQDTATIGTMYAGETYIYPGGTDFYTIVYANPTGITLPTITINFNIDITETPDPAPAIEGEGLTVEVWDVTEIPPKAITQITDFAPGQSVKFEIHVTADAAIDHTSTYGYTITMVPNDT